MVKQIMQVLLEHQEEISSLHLSKSLQQPLNTIEELLQSLQEKYPGLLSLNYNYDSSLSFIVVKIAEGGEEVARKLLAGFNG